MGTTLDRFDYRFYTAISGRLRGSEGHRRYGPRAQLKVQPPAGGFFVATVHADNYSYQHEDSECKIGRFKIGSDRIPAKSTACVKARFGWPAVAGAPPAGLRGHCRYCLIASQRVSRKFGELLLGVMLEVGQGFDTEKFGTMDTSESLIGRGS
ncbi:hypothetical protein [Cupriavidus sp. 8B]